MNYMIANMLLFLLPSTRWFGIKRRLLRALGVTIGEDSKVCGHVRFFGAGKVSIGSQVWIGPATEFHTSIGGDIAIGDRCDIAPGVAFVTGSHDMGDAHRRAGRDIAHPIAVGAGSWIGARAMLLGGTRVAQGTMIAAGSLVLDKPWPENALLAGAPARVLRQLPTGSEPAS